MNGPEDKIKMKKIFDYIDKLVNKNKKTEGKIDIHAHEDWELYYAAKGGLDYIKKCEMLGNDSHSSEMFEVTEGTYRGLPISIYSPHKDNPNYVKKVVQPDGQGLFDVRYTVRNVKSKSSKALSEKSRKLIPELEKLFGEMMMQTEICGSSDCFYKGVDESVKLRGTDLTVEFDKEKKQIIIRKSE